MLLPSSFEDAPFSSMLDKHHLSWDTCDIYFDNILEGFSDFAIFFRITVMTTVRQTVVVVVTNLAINNSHKISQVKENRFGKLIDFNYM